MVSDLRMYRGDYERGKVPIKDFQEYPLQHLHEWLIEAYEKGEQFPNTMTLSTMTQSGVTMRTVPLKSFKNEKLRFFSSYDKGDSSELESNCGVGVHFFFKKMKRQIFIRGDIEKIPVSESENHFNDQSNECKITIWALRDGKTILKEEKLKNHFDQIRKKFNGISIPCPEFWSGYDITPKYVEFFEGIEDGLHQKVIYQLINGKWTKKKTTS
ncbi:pyridoxal 5'-phosphate synthase [uncultured Ilyobacter sp.]|uniref:pyridoxine/pyridoxamine 5'-phosphate oxidase n=1 Tax=uncultured Ilyobacter sp. TaxID=544433 RepID=UPI0029C8F61D|nr:pyridoxal 5'-phosphate synthase [uncultured Ilyobacter sp.]